MTEYTAQIAGQIERLIAQRGAVSASDLAGVSDADASAFLARYAAEHAGEGVRVEAGVLLREVPAPAETTGPAPTLVPPAAPGAAPASDAPAPAPVSGSLSFWLWVLTLVLAPVGGIVAWALVKDRDPQAGRRFVLATIAMVVLPACLGVGAALLLPRGLVPSTSASTWPVSTTGRPTFYYFGTAT